MKNKSFSLLFQGRSSNKLISPKASNKVMLILSFFVVGYMLFMAFRTEEEPMPFIEFLRTMTTRQDYFWIAIALFLTIFLIQVLRFVILLFLTNRQLKVKLSFKTVVIGRFYTIITPMLVGGGQVFQAKVLSDDKISRAKAIGLPYAELFMKLIIWNMIIIFFLIFNQGVTSTIGIRAFAIFGLVIGSIWPVILIIFLINERLAKRILKNVVKIAHVFRVVKNYDYALSQAWSFLEDLSTSFKNILKNVWSFALLIVTYAVEFFALMGLPYFLFGAAGLEVEFWQMTIGYMFVYITSMAVPIPGAAGVYELLFVAQFSHVAPSNILYWLLITMRFLTLFFYIIIGYAAQWWSALKKYLAKRSEIRKLIDDHMMYWSEEWKVGGDDESITS